MNKNIIYGSIGIVILIALVSGLVILFSPEPEDKQPTSLEGGVPARVSQLGPYVKNVRFVEKIGTYDLAVEAKVLHMKKTRIMGFDSALYKQVVTRNTRLTLYRDDSKVLEVIKDRVIMTPNMRVIEIQAPQVLFPEGMKDIRKIRVDKVKKIMKIYRPGGVDTWNLNTP